MLTRKAIERCIAQDLIRIEPFDEALLNPISYDLRLAPTLTSRTGEVVTLPEDPNQPFWLPRNTFWNAYSIEEVSFPHGAEGSIMGMLHNKSGTARNGASAHLGAGIINPDHVGPVRFHIHVVEDFPATRGMRFAQLTFPMTIDERALFDTPFREFEGVERHPSNYIDPEAGRSR